VSNFC